MGFCWQNQHRIHFSPFFRKSSEPIIRFGVLDDACPDFVVPVGNGCKHVLQSRLTPIVAEAKVD
jgi:hypothetical protein